MGEKVDESCFIGSNLSLTFLVELERGLVQVNGNGCFIHVQHHVWLARDSQLGFRLGWPDDNH